MGAEPPRPVMAESGMAAFEMETLKSCPLLSMDSAGLFRPVPLIQIPPECATSGHAPYPAFTLVE